MIPEAFASGRRKDLASNAADEFLFRQVHLVCRDGSVRCRQLEDKRRSHLPARHFGSFINQTEFLVSTRANTMPGPRTVH
jgi:hypothetical protein